MTYTATMEVLLRALRNSTSTWLSSAELYRAYRERAKVPVSRRTIYRNLKAMIELGWIESDAPARMPERKFRILPNGRAAHVDHYYGDSIKLDKIKHDHVFGRLCPKCERDKERASSE